jgi:hypothetical protein
VTRLVGCGEIGDVRQMWKYPGEKSALDAVWRERSIVEDVGRGSATGAGRGCREEENKAKER